MEDDSHLVNLLNASGFPFQLAVGHLVSTYCSSDYKVAAGEHPWRHLESGRAGFIDIIVEKYAVRFVIECKRTRDASWLFLVPDKHHQSVTIFDCHWNCLLAAGTLATSWNAVHLKPNHPLSSFCCTRGKGDGDSPFLDNIGASLVYATEALAMAESSLRSPGYEDFVIYLPVIVTNAQLFTAAFDPAQVDLKSGQVRDCECVKVGAVRYRKALDPGFVPTPAAQSINDANVQSQRSLFVVNIEHFASFLEDLNFVRDPSRDYPWTVAKRRYSEGRTPI